MTTRVGIAVVGAGMAGQAHAFGYRNVKMHPNLANIDLDLVAIADSNDVLAESVALRYGFTRAYNTIDAVIDDDTIDAVSLALPNSMYASIIPRLLDAGKHVLAEKPLGRSAAEALRFVTAADAAQRVNCVGFSWRRLPAVEYIATLVRGGGIGTVRHLSAWYLTDYASTADTPLSWRYDRNAAGGGAIVDVGAHIVSVVERVVGAVRRVLAADARIFIPERPVAAGAVVGHTKVQTTGEVGPVTTDDVTMLLAEFEGGSVGQITVSRVATGVPNSLGFHIIGSEGSVSFDSVHPDEFQLYTTALEEPGRNGSRTVIVGPDHPYFGHTIPMPARGVGSGYGAAFIAQAQDFVGAIVNGGRVETDFWAGYHTMLVCEAAQRASDQHGAVDIATVDAELRSGVGVR